MKYRKPDGVLNGWASLVDFVDSLPDEFEILGPGEVAVKWPEGLTKSHLKGVSLGISWPPARTAIDALAAIAPERKKRKVYLWEKDYPHYTERSWTSDDISRPGKGWRKVGECEVDA